MSAASMFQGRSSSHRARIEGGACLLSDVQLACCLCMPAKSERIRLSYLTNFRIAASSPPSVSGYIRRCRGPSSVARSLCPDGSAPRSRRIDHRCPHPAGPISSRRGNRMTAGQCPVLVLSGHIQAGSRMSALRGEADVPQSPGPYQSDAIDPKRTSD
jgi:hypothetical protein